jgi:NAD(P)-dependent dehydrogenase (short-subunit alcohol dehydrogenase family)
MGRFEDEAVILTGATGGFGRRLAERLSAGGARLVLADLDKRALSELAATLPGKVSILAGDVASEEHLEELVTLAVSEFGRLDLAINNAGIGQSFVKLASVPSNEARRILEIDLLGVFFAMKHQLARMESQYRNTGVGGRIVNIASVAGLGGSPRLSVYSAAKHGVVGLTRTAAAEYASKGIRVNAVCPSYARTDMVGNFLKMSGRPIAEAEAELTRGVPLKRVAEIDEIVEVILFAADKRNSFMTGQALAADGGITAI